MNGSNQIVIALTGAGGPAVPSMIDVLRKNFFCRILALDMEKNSAGFFMADLGVVVPAGNSPEFLPAIRKLCKDEKVDVIISVVDEELVSCLELEKEGVKVIQPLRDFTELCLDKYALMKELIKQDISAPKTFLASEIKQADIQTLAFPLILKPRVGRGSRGIQVIQSASELQEILESKKIKLDQFILQDYIDGPEYTVSVVAWRDGQVQAVVPKEIILKQGVTKIAVSRKNAEIDRQCFKIQEKLKASGPFNVQLRLDKKTGKSFIFEINPRFSTSVTLTIASGIDELSGLIHQALKGKSAHVFGSWNEGKMLVRRNLDFFPDENSVKIVNLT